MRIDHALRWVTSTLAQSDTAALDARLLLCYVTGQSQTWLLTWPDRTLTEEQQNQLQQVVERRRQGEPIAHITGVRDFWTLRLHVNKATLIPRPETELLVEKTLQLSLPDNARVLDLGTGTGAIALALASENPLWRVLAVDRIPAAVELAEKNARANGVNNVEVMQSHWFDDIAIQGFDVIVSNPPYVELTSPWLRQGDVRFEPDSALTAGEDGLDDIRQICQQAPGYLQPGGWLLIEHGYQQGQAVATIFASTGFTNIATYKDLAGQDRITIGQISLPS